MIRVVDRLAGRDSICGVAVMTSYRWLNFGSNREFAGVSESLAERVWSQAIAACARSKLSTHKVEVDSMKPAFRLFTRDMSTLLTRWQC